MKFAILVDYANLFLSVKNIKSYKTSEEVESELYKIFASLKQKLNEPFKVGKRDRNIQPLAFVCYVLDYESFGNPEKVYKDLNVTVKRVKKTGKSDEMKSMNQSQDDDSLIMSDARKLATQGGIDGILVVTNDGDFVALGEQLNQIGKLFWAGVYGDRKNVSHQLRKRANLVLPLHEIVDNIDEGEALEENEIVADEEVITGPHLEIYYRKQVILRYPISTTPIEIGRRSSSLFHYPQIDLTESDSEKVVSRRHATITPIGNRLLFAVNSKCDRGTWRNKRRVYRGEQFFFEPDMQVVIGSSTGFGIRYRLN